MIPIFLIKDKMDSLMYREAKYDNPGLPALEKSGVERGSAVWPEVTSDLWSGLFKADPKLSEKARGPLAEAFQDVMQTAKWKKLRTQTKLDQFGS